MICQLYNWYWSKLCGSGSELLWHAVCQRMSVSAYPAIALCCKILGDAPPYSCPLPPLVECGSVAMICLPQPEYSDPKKVEQQALHSWDVHAAHSSRVASEPITPDRSLYISHSFLKNAHCDSDASRSISGHSGFFTGVRGCAAGALIGCRSIVVVNAMKVQHNHCNWGLNILRFEHTCSPSWDI